MKFSQDFIERVQNANNLVDLISQYTQLRPVGKGLMGRCPFPDHQEKTPSFSVSEYKQVYNCFGCHKRGNIFTFLQTFNGMSFPEAIEYLATRANIPMPESSVSNDRDEQFSRKKKSILEVNRIALEFFSTQLSSQSEDSVVQTYAKKRALVGDLVEGFHLGYAPQEWDAFVSHLQKRGFDLAIAEEAGLIKKRTQGKSGYFDIFRHRLMFPILSPMNEVLGFGGRVLDDSNPKYLNSPESIVFSKGRLLYGLDLSAKYMRSQDQAIVVEGYMDMIALYRAGIHNVGATLGTALTLDHGRLLKRMTLNVIVLFDGDQAGKNAAERSLPLLLQSGVIPRGVTLPDELDPDEFIDERGVEGLKEHLNNAQDLFSLVFSHWLEGYRGEASQKIKLCDRLKPVINVIEDERLRGLYLSEAAQRMGVELRWLRQAMHDPKGEARSFSRNFISSDARVALDAPTTRVEQTSATPDAGREFFVSLKGLSKREEMALGLTLKSRANFDLVIEQSGLQWISHDGARKLLERAQELYRQEPSKFDRLTSLLASYVDRPEILIESAVPESEETAEGESTHSQKILSDCLLRLKDEYLKRQAEALAKELKTQTSLQNLQTEKLQQVMELNRSRLKIGTKDAE